MHDVDRDTVPSGVYARDQTNHNLIPAPFLLSLVMQSELTTGIVAKAYNAVDPAEIEDLQPTVQLLSIKKVANARDSSTADRYRIIVSDGVQFIQAMLATQLNDLVESSQIRRNVIVRLTKFAAQNISAKRWGVCSHEDEPLISSALGF